MNKRDIAENCDRYVTLRRSLGFRNPADERLLNSFVAYIEASNLNEAISPQGVVKWACSTGHSCSLSWQSHRLSVVRGYLRHLRTRFSQIVVPSRHLLGRGLRRSPHIFTKDEIASLLHEARSIQHCDRLRPYTISTVIGLLFSCGLRATEALNLRFRDVHLRETPPSLCISKTKFRKSRLVPMHESTASAMREYVAHRHRLVKHDRCEFFFVHGSGRAISYCLLSRTFRSLRSTLGISADAGKREPTLHCLRHTFAVSRLIAWYRSGEDVLARLPELSVYLGHVAPKETYWYLTATPQLLSLAGQRFEALVSSGAAS